MRIRGRPYPKDVRRMIAVKTELIKRDLSIYNLSVNTGINYKCLSEIISGRRNSLATEKKIAKYFGKRHEELFPVRSSEDIETARKKEKKRGKVA